VPVLAAITYLPNADFCPQRQELALFAIHWHNPTDLLVAGNPSEVKENDYGGYRAVVRFPSWIWDYDNRSIPLNRLFDDLYALAPGSSTPSSLGAIQVRWEFKPEFNAQIIAIDLAVGVMGDYWLQEFPTPSRHYWQELHWTLPALPSVVPG
jgi:hypothetical protein